MKMFKNTPAEQKQENAPRLPDVKSEKKKKRKSFLGWKVKLFVWVLMLSLVIGGITQVVMWVGSWFDENKIVPHQVIELRINPPFTIEPRFISPVASPSAEPATGGATPSGMFVVQPVMAQEPSLIDQLESYIHLAESTRGKAATGLAVTCRNKGMSNEYGYRALEGFCFSDKEEATATVKDWLYRSLQVRGVAETLCRYNTGNPVSDCDYANTFMELLAEGKI